MYHQDLLIYSPWNGGGSVSERGEAAAGSLLQSWAWTWRRVEDLQLAYQLCWLVWCVSSQGMPVGVGGWDKAMSRRRKLGGVNPCDPLVMGAWGTGGCRRCSAIELGIKLGIGFGGAMGEGKNFSTCWPGWRGREEGRHSSPAGEAPRSQTARGPSFGDL